jgi:hypothetical protein
VIIDACYAGAGASEFAQIANRLTVALAGGPAVFILAAARPKQEADQGAFSSALAEALANSAGQLGGCTQEFLTMDDVMESVHGYLRMKHPAQTATWSSVNVSGRCRLFPNPRHRSFIPRGLDLEAQRAFLEHWVPKARSAELGAGGWYFTGRSQALTEIAEWLSAEHSDGRPRIVTGGPGSGKSAVLARVITLADPTYREEILEKTVSKWATATLPPAGIVNVAVHARHKLLAEVTSEIASALNISAGDPTELLHKLASQREKVVIVVDALDEADDKYQIALRLLRPLATLPNIFLLVGSRPDSSESGRKFGSLGENVVEINLDHERYVGKDDIALYVERRLVAAEEPGRSTLYQDSRETARAVAKAVAERAGNVFLVAHTATHTLLAVPSIVDIKQAEWVKLLPTGLEEAFAQFLDELDGRQAKGLSSLMVRAVLLPLAFAEGEGLPWVDIWAAAARGLSSISVSNADIAVVRATAAAFIVESNERDRSVYRLYHERFAELLRDSVPNRIEAQRCITEALCSTVPSHLTETKPDWSRAHPYLLLHLAAHAQKGGMLAEIVSDGLFVAAADPIRTLQVLSFSRDPIVRRIYDWYSLAFDKLRDQPPAVRLSYLHMIALQQSDGELADLVERAQFARPWTTLWADFSPVSPHRTISTFPPESSIALGAIDGCPIIVSGGREGAIRVRDLGSGIERGKSLGAHFSAVTEVAVGTFKDRLFAVSCGSDGAIRTWDLSSGEASRSFVHGHKGTVRAIALGEDDGRPIIVSGGYDGPIRVWDFELLKQRGPPMSGHKSGVLSIALGVFEGRPIVVSGGLDGSIRVWDLALGRQRDNSLSGHRDGVTSLVKFP